MVERKRASGPNYPGKRMSPYENREKKEGQIAAEVGANRGD